MTTNTLIRTIIVAAVIAAKSAALANNNLFLPGDAFFPTVLTQDDVAALLAARSGERVFAYSALGGYEGAFCGYAGYRNAVIPAVDDAFAKNLATVYARVREMEDRRLVEITRDGKLELVETNGMGVLFYPPEFEFPRHHLGLRYNENWVAEAVKFGHQRERLRLCCLVPDPGAVERSWRDAAAIAPLRVQLPQVALEPVPATESPVVVQGPVQAIVIGSHSLHELFRPGDAFLTVSVVDAQGIRTWVHEAGQWRDEQSQAE